MGPILQIILSLVVVLVLVVLCLTSYLLNKATPAPEGSEASKHELSLMSEEDFDSK